MNGHTAPEERKFKLTADEREQWDENGYFVRHGVFTEAENDVIRQIADDIALGKRTFPDYHIFENALVRDGKVEAQGVHAMHNIQYVNNPLLKHGGLCEAHTKRSLHKVNYFLQ